MPSILNATTTSGLVTSADNSGSLQLQTNNGTTAVTIDTSQNVGIGTTSVFDSAGRVLTVNGTGSSRIEMGTGGATRGGLYTGGTELNLYSAGAIPLNLGTNYSTRMTIDTSGNVQVNGYSSNGSASSLRIGNVTDYQGRFYLDSSPELFYIENTSDYSLSGIAFKTNNAERMRIASDGSVGIGITNPNSYGKLAVNGSVGIAAGNYAYFYNSGNTNYSAIACVDTTGMAFYTAATERMRITSGGLLLIGTTSGTPNPGFSFDPNGTLSIGNNAAASGFEFQTYRRSGVQIGSVYQNGTTAVLYNTTSDYRLKENIAPMTGALATVAQLKPCTYTWKVDGSAGQGFIAHELQAVVPDCVAGEKDAVETYIDEEGNEQTRIKPQGIDTSFLVATLTAAIQELKAELDTVKAELNTLKNPPVEGTE